MDEVKVYTLAEVAAILKVTRRTLYNYVKAGTLPAVKIGKSWRVSEEALKSFISTGAPAEEESKAKRQRSHGAAG